MPIFRVGYVVALISNEISGENAHTLKAAVSGVLEITEGQKMIGMCLLVEILDHLSVREILCTKQSSSAGGSLSLSFLQQPVLPLSRVDSQPLCATPQRHSPSSCYVLISH